MHRALLTAAKGDRHSGVYAGRQKELIGLLITDLTLDADSEPEEGKTHHLSFSCNSQELKAREGNL